MGQAKRRKAEIETLRRDNPAADGLFTRLWRMCRRWCGLG
jgi:hypothetical protein